MLGAKKEEPVVLAIEHRAEADNFESSNAQRRSQQFLDSSALFGGVATPNLRPASTASAQRLSNVTPVSPALFDRPASLATASAAAPNPSASTTRHSRRLSRHARTPSVSTKRESMEIMGGLGAGLGLDMANTTLPLHSVGSSRRRSSRMSNLPSASLLFGSSDPSSTTANSSNNNNRVSGQQWDWRKAIADAAEEAEEGAEGRLTALDKLEGRTAPSAAPSHTAQGDRPSSLVTTASRASRRLSGHTRTESIQIPNLDEIHRNEINERRASWNSQALDTPSSAPAASASNRRESWGRSLVPPSTSSLLSAGFSSPALPSTYLSSPGRPVSMIERAESPQPEGLGTLMEEEEEDDASSPTRERPSLDMHVEGRTTAEQELRKQRREVEDETVKRNRRASLAPKPLKLKSRPPSLYLTPSQRNGLVSSPSMPNFSTSPLLAHATLAEEVTPKASLAALPESADSEESQVLEQSEQQEASIAMPSRSTTCPDLSTIAAISEEAEDNSQEEKHADSPVATEVSAEDVASQEQRQLEELQQQILRAHRNSVIAPAPAPSSADSASASSTGTPSRQGMRALRLGSQANLTSIIEAPSATASISPSNSGTITTTPAQRRRSLIMGPVSANPVSGSSSRDNDFVNAFGSSAASSSRAARRSSIIYKPSTASVPESAPSHSASDSIASLGGVVPLTVHDELKAKASRDAALLESTKKQVEMLERELANECERSAREKAELEQWNLDKEEHLFDRAQRAETAARQAEDSVVAMRAELEQTKEQLEDLNAHCEVLQDDIEGWRSRCQDLEKTLRIEKAKSDENRKLRAAARLRIKQLTDAIDKGQGTVPADELGVLAALEMPQLDLATVLRSPNLGAISPNLSAVTPSGGLSPSIGHEEAPPQITKLLADMRQQIFNLAGSLEHERKQHLHAKEEIARLQQQSIEVEHSANATDSAEKVLAAIEGAAEQSFDDSRDVSTSDSFSGNSAHRSSGVLGKNKRHMFAYDSSMGSFGQSQSSASLSMTTNTDDTIHTDNDSDMSDSFSAKLPSSESEHQLIGLGMGSLQTLDEIEEVSEVSESVEGSNGTLSAALHSTMENDKGSNSPAWVDIEAGNMDLERPSLEMSESSFGATYQDAEHAPPTPDLYRSASVADASGHFAAAAAASNSIGGASGEHNSTQSSSSSSTSADSHAAPSTPPTMHAAAAPAAAAAAVMRNPSPRPEFHREWSFEWGKVRAAKTPSEEHAIEDFFGIFSEDVLPPLSSSEEALDLPPIRLPTSSNGTLAPTAKINKDGRPMTTSHANTMRSASVFGNRRPPVARSAYLRESFDTTSANSLSLASSSMSGGLPRYGHEAQASSASSLAAIGSRALSRMSLQGLTGAFSGLSGYLTNQSGAAVTAAKMCNSLDVKNGANGWASRNRFVEEVDEEDEFGGSSSFGKKGGKVMDVESGTGGYDLASVGQLSWSAAVHQKHSTGSTVQQQQQSSMTRRYVRKSAVAPPKATPVWLLDFTASTVGIGGGPVFTL